MKVPEGCHECKHLIWEAENHVAGQALGKSGAICGYAPPFRSVDKYVLKKAFNPDCPIEEYRMHQKLIEEMHEKLKQL